MAQKLTLRRIAALYAELFARVPSPIVQLNRAPAVGMAEGLDVGLVIVDGLLGERRISLRHARLSKHRVRRFGGLSRTTGGPKARQQRHAD